MNALDKTTAQGIAFAIAAGTGETPTVVYTDDSAEISFSPDQAKRLSDRLLNELNSTKSSPVRVNVAPVILPAVLKKYGIYFVGAVALIYLLGRKRIPF